MGHYNLSSDKIKEFISKGCPVKIGDMVDYHYYAYEPKVAIAEVIDIRCHTKADYLNEIDMDLVTMGLITINKEVLDDPIMKFTITLKYKEPVRKKNFWGKKVQIGFVEKIDDYEMDMNNNGRWNQWIVKRDETL